MALLILAVLFTDQDVSAGSSADSNVCVLLHAGGSQEASTSSTGHAHIVWSWQTTSPIKSGEECSDFSQSTINMRDLE